MIRLMLALMVVALAAWSALALAFGPLEAPALGLAMAGVGLGAATSMFVPRWRRFVVPFFGLAFAVFLLYWSNVRPTNDRDWQPEVAVLPYATFDGDRVTIHNVRNFDYRSETDFTPRYYDKTLDLRDLDSLDFVASYWMGERIAHIMVSFGFAGRDFLAVSIETRKARGQEYSTVKGFFRQYGLTYVVADERDLIGVRTNYRKNPPEEVYLFRTNAPPENVRRLFLDYFREINSLVETPKFYNSLTTNCTTNVLMHTRVNRGRQRYNWKVLLSGYAPLYTYELGRLDTRLPYDELKRRSQVNEAARAADGAADFSQRIRAGVPDPRKENP
jgi:hypothetical protein